MAAHLRPLTPDRSYADRLGAMVRERRLVSLMSQQHLGQRVYASSALIRKVEHAERFPREDLIVRIDTVLQADGRIVAVWRRANAERRQRRFAARQQPAAA
jgi:ribosome-binding protein aMBF1 (putative translation factor)